MTNEVWKDIEGYEGLYQVSNMGNVKSVGYGKERVLKFGKNNDGYLRVVLYKEGKGKTHKVHRLVAQAFIPNPENKEQIDHLNTIRTDNRVENLRWVTPKENNNNPLTKEHRNVNRNVNIYKIKGGNNGRARKVYCDKMIFGCIRECANYYNINDITMGSWLIGRYKMPQRFVDLGLRYATEEDLKLA